MKGWRKLGIGSLRVWRQRSLRFLVLLMLTFTLVMFLAVPSQPQTTPPQSREDLIQRVEEQAKLDVDIGSSAKPETLTKRYQNNTFGVSEEEIELAYKKAYKQAKEEKERDLSERLPKGWQGWATAIIFAILLIFRDTLIDSGKTISTKINDWIYQKFSGTKWFWGVALEKYRKSLGDKYRELAIPFRPNRPLKMAEVFVPLKMAGSRNSEQIDAYRAIVDFPRLMVKGQPGSGKTMLLKNIALRCADGRLRELGDPVAILLELHRLSDPTVTIEQQLVEALKRDDFPNATAFVQHGLENGTILLLFDGLDEVNSIDRASVVQRLQDFLDQYEKCRALITCRTQVYREEFANRVNATLEVMEFSDRQIRQFLNPWKAGMPPEKSIDQLLQALRDRPRILELARNPLLLTIIAYLYSDTPFVLPHSRSEFYAKSTEILLEVWDQARQTPNRYKGFTKKLVLQQLALFAQDSANQRSSDRRSLDFRDVLSQVKAILPNLNLSVEDAQLILDEIVDRSGLLMRIDGGERYQFTHLTLQEFFVASQLKDNPTELIQRFERDPDAWREVMKLWCGLANDSTEVIRQAYDLDPIVAFEALADAQKIDSDVADGIIESFQIRLGHVIVGAAIEQAFGAVASDMRPRGQRVFQFLVDMLEVTERKQRIAAMKALSLTNSSKATQVLFKHYSNLPEIRSSVVRMGDLAVPFLAEAIQLGKGFAIDDLAKIGTPKAAQTLAQLLWDSNLGIAGRSAWYLATLLSQDEVEEALQNLVLTVEQKAAEHLDWVWFPFDNDPNSTISIVAGRIAYWLEETPREAIPSTLSTIDRRLVIPICAIPRKHSVELPKQWTDEAEAFLQAAQQDSKSVTEQKLTQLVDEVLESEPRSRWRRFLLSGLAPVDQLDLLRRLITSNRNPETYDWKFLWRKLDYRFKNGWHYRLVLIIAAVLSVVAIGYSIYLPFHAPNQWSSWLVGLSVVVIVDSWLVIWKGIEERLEPELFLKFGVFGFLNFWKEIDRLYRERLVWEGARVLFEILSANKAIGVVAGVVAGAVAGAVVGTGIIVGTSVIVGAIAGVIFGVVTISGKRTSTGVVAGVCASIGAIAGIGAVSVAGIGAVAGFVTVTVAGFGIDLWHRAESKDDTWRFGAVLAYPFFWGAPLVVIYTTLALLTILPQQAVVAFWCFLCVLCTLLWKRGQFLDRRARNPLQDIIPNPNAPNS